MTRDKIQAFTIRVTNGNRTQLVVVLYDLFQQYIDDAAKARKEENREEFKENIRRADSVLTELMSALDFKYEISAELYRLYAYCRERLAMSMVKYDCAGLAESEKIMKSLGGSFRELAKTDNSPPVMKNAQKVTYGATYGRTDISEDFGNTGNRGFLA